MDSKEKVFSVLAYFGILVLIPTLASSHPFTRFHANQGLVLWIAGMISAVVVGIISAVLGFIPFIGPILGVIIGGAVSIVLFVLAIIGIVHAVNEETKPLPIIGGITILK